MIDYSRWNNIEVSDDEDETHPNIDTPSLFKWRHEARVQRMKEFEEEKARFAAKKSEFELKMQRLRAAATESPNDENVKQEKEELYRKFVNENEKSIKHYGLLSKWDDCKQYLLENPHLCCEDTANYLALWCLNLEIEEKHDLMEHVAKQVISMQYILELAKQLNRDPRSCISSFFTRIQKADAEYINAYEDELKSFKERIRERAKARIEKAFKEIEEEERQKRLGPGGLDPVEVMESLPPALQECFEKKDIALLQQVISQMDEKEASYHIKRCIDSGLWIPDAKAAKEEGKEENGASEVESSTAACGKAS
ncbi:hsp90 co-chaperone Cdc37-like protein [Dinothrombium tinctorium]|uniref:Hsp90 co-chaperone Cdc37 n=1 Tax=Dinothrombium tinctorium TaxID=1965070 RepID=A0A3S3SIT8_9ACAR|nr:hsp90 co-chaperone Cdc37-like protein [Dinothrombium tinctorium]